MLKTIQRLEAKGLLALVAVVMIPLAGEGFSSVSGMMLAFAALPSGSRRTKNRPGAPSGTAPTAAAAARRARHPAVSTLERFLCTP